MTGDGITDALVMVPFLPGTFPKKKKKVKVDQTIWRR